MRISRLLLSGAFFLLYSHLHTDVHLSYTLLYTPSSIYVGLYAPERAASPMSMVVARYYVRNGPFVRYASTQRLLICQCVGAAQPSG
ncbi:hypothetical protein F5B19DRAFT_475254 [Rostrohypoxylon terebratum]|nr:hypothetical protein F5B19DRAFT_475254 [Rostrohypoxylon terebratum]